MIKRTFKREAGLNKRHILVWEKATRHSPIDSKLTTSHYVLTLYRTNVIHLLTKYVSVTATCIKSNTNPFGSAEAQLKALVAQGWGFNDDSTRLNVVAPHNVVWGNKPHFEVGIAEDCLENCEIYDGLKGMKQYMYYRCSFEHGALAFEPAGADTQIQEQNTDGEAHYHNPFLGRIPLQQPVVSDSIIYIHTPI